MLTAYRVHYDNGDVRPTDMAKDVTLKMAREYFVGKQFEFVEGQPLVTAIRVDPIREPNQGETHAN